LLAMHCGGLAGMFVTKADVEDSKYWTDTWSLAVAKVNKYCGLSCVFWRKQQTGENCGLGYR